MILLKLDDLYENNKYNVYTKLVICVHQFVLFTNSISLPRPLFRNFLINNTHIHMYKDNYPVFHYIKLSFVIQNLFNYVKKLFQKDYYKV